MYSAKGNIKLGHWERIERVICWAGLNSHSFAAHIGLHSPQTLYQIKAGKHGISRALAEKISAHYPEISFVWLVSGNGPMLNPSDKAIPYYLDDCESVALAPESYLPTGYTSVPKCGDCSFAARTATNAMEPLVAQGAMLFCKECKPTDIYNGELVLVVYGNRAVVRTVKSISPTELLLSTPQNTPQTDLKIELTLVRQTFRIKATLAWQSV